MTPPLPAHVVALACACGLAIADAARLHGPAGAALAAAAASVAAASCVPAGWQRAAVAAALVLAGSWWWGSARLDALDRSVLAPRIGTADRFVVVTTAEARRGRFDQRQRAKARGEPVELQLRPGRSPPQGARVSVLAVVKAPRGPQRGFDERTWLRRQGVHVVLHVDEWHVVGRRGGVGGVADRVRRWLRHASAPGLRGERHALVEGVLLGDDAGLSDGLKQAFRRSGLYHLLAVSGQNVVLLAGGVLGLFVVVGIGRAYAHAAALAAIGCYVLAVGPQPSVVRAAVAGAAVSVAWLAGRLRDAWHVLLLAACVLLAWNPYTLFDAGFQLSFGAVVAIFVLGGPLRRQLEGYPMPAWLRTALAISVACTIVTAPFLWLQFDQVPLYGVAANALVEPVMPLLLGLAFGAAAVDPLAPGLAADLAWLNGWVAAYVAGCARAVSALPAAQASGRGAALAAAAALAVAALLWRRILRPYP
ncbi:MAG TPA: ComEC/Rec2 family competence protein [Gaiellaceae bacterium]|nr:ComEC/Rec2 family competence protein [Gaiellaceae bacterium]